MMLIKLDDLKRYRADRIAHGNCDHDEMQALAWFINTVDTIEIDEPAIDAASVVHGKWKRKMVDNGFNIDWVCSKCGYRVMTDFVSYNYCPNCGARMFAKDTNVPNKKGADDEA